MHYQGAVSASFARHKIPTKHSMLRTRNMYALSFQKATRIPPHNLHLAVDKLTIERGCDRSTVAL